MYTRRQLEQKCNFILTEGNKVMKLVQNAMLSILTEEEVDTRISSLEVTVKAAPVTCKNLLSEELKNGDIYFDSRCSKILIALNNAATTAEKYTNCALLHDAPQRYPSDVLFVELDRELNRLLRGYIFDKERENRFLNSPILDKDTFVGQAKQKDNIMDTGLSPQSEGVTNKSGNKRFEFGFKGCAACQQSSCNWKSTESNINNLQDRRDELSCHLHIIAKTEENTIVSHAPASTKRGGGTRFHRQDLIRELSLERDDIDRRISLYKIDKDLHDSYASRKTYLEVSSLHGYSTLMNVEEARNVLEKEHNKLVAKSVAKEIIDGILHWMLEGWYFGEFLYELKQPSLQNLQKTDRRMDLNKLFNAEHGKSPYEKALPIMMAATARSSTVDYEKKENILA